MSIYTSYDTACRVLRAPRRLLCLPLPEGFKAPVTPASESILAERIGDLLGIATLTSSIHRLGANQWLMAFFHGQTTRHRAATYENGRPGAVTYTPRQVALVVADAANGLLYVSATNRAHSTALLPALNGTLFPNRPIGMPFQAFCFDLNILPILRQNERHPQENHYPWRNLTLKSITWKEAGLNSPISKTVWCADGFEALELQSFIWPRHLLTAGLAFQPEGGRTQFSVDFAHQQSLLRASLSPKTLDGLAALIRLCTHQNTARVQL
ncbi:MAG: hypothetical protein IJV69_04600 [Kiritimatiellae bacterium]|nr:hypothetical protein [Kiritimatiellia bacterium]